MLKPHTIFAALFLLFISLSNALAQSDPTRSDKPRPLTIIASMSEDRVRFAAPASVVQIRLEVYSSTGRKLFDNELRGGNVLDWLLQNGQAESLADDTYLCVVSVKNLSGRITQRIGSVRVEKNRATLVAAAASRMSAQQTEAIGPVEEDPELTILKEGENQTATVIAHNGSEGQLIRGQGALSFRIGDFFAAKDREQMRLTEEGNLGIGTATPQARLDVAGMIRTQGLILPDGSVLTSAASIGLPDGSDLKGTIANLGKKKGQQLMPEAFGQISGDGTANTIPKFTGANTIANSALTEVGGNVGIGTATPGGQLHIFGTATADVFAGMGPDVINGPAFNYGYSGASFGRGSGFFNVRPDASAVAPNPSLRFATANVQRMIITNLGNVGIGNLAPSAKLDVTGNISTSTQYNIGNFRVLSIGGIENTFAGAGAGTSPTNTGSANSFFGTSSGLTNMSGSSNSFLGAEAGLNNQAGSNNTFVGYLSGRANLTGNNNAIFGAFAGLTNTSGLKNTIIGEIADVATGNLTNATALGSNAQVAQSNSLVLGSISGINLAVADTSVGIGTTAPANPLDVNGVGSQSGGVAGFAEVAARFRQRTAATHSAVSIDALTGRDAILYLAENGAAVWDIRNDSDQGGKFQIRFQTLGANRPYFSVNPSGEIGMGTTTPNAALQISSSITEQVLSATSDLTTGTWFNLGNTGASGNTWSLISTGTATNGGPGKLFIRDNNAGQVRAAIDTFGNFGIGIGNPNDRLHVVGDIRMGTGTTGCVKDADGTVLTGTCSSDARFKRDITPFPKLLDQLVRLQPVNFYWRADEYPEKAFGSSRSFGLIAQDVEQVLPELVTEDQKGFKSVRYNKLPLMLLQGLKELKADNDSLRRENDALKQKIEEQEARLRKLETKLNQ